MKRCLRCSVCLLLALSFLICGLPAHATDKAADAFAAVEAYCLEQISEAAYGDEWLVYTAASTGNLSERTKTAYYNSLCTQLEKTNGVLDSRKYTEFSRVILALTALGYDAQNVEGDDLTLALADYDAVMRQGVNGAVFALLALDSGSYQIPQTEKGKTQATRERYLAAIREQQFADGGFSVSGKQSDPDTTAMVLQALAKYQNNQTADEIIRKGLAYLSDAQRTDGEFENWDVINSESSAQVILTLCELGIPLDDSRFVKDGKTLLDILLRYQKTDGSFSHLPEGKTDFLATRQAYQALAALQLAEKGAGYYAVLREAAFSDILDHPDREAMEALAAAGIISGVGDGTFDPDGTMTRASFAALIVRGIGAELQITTRFRDVSPSAWHAGYIGAAYEAGIILGVSDTRFDPDGTITDREAEAMVARAARYLGISPTTRESWASSSVLISRSEVAAMLYELLSGAGLLNVR